MDKITLLSFAKINLCLYVLGKRKDGFHDIVSVIQAIDLADEMELAKISCGIEIDCDHPGVPSGRTNLAYLAARAFFDKCNLKSGVRIKISKKVLPASGLGGGSSNAAYALKGLNQLYEAGLSREELVELGAKIGSDIPFFFCGGQALAKGRGERVGDIKIFDDYWLVLVNPGLKIRTPWAYRALKMGLTSGGIGVNLRFCRERHSFFSAISSWENHLEVAVCRKYPIIRNIKETLINLGAIKASMSGSGPTVYGLFETQSFAEEVKAKISKGDWQIELTRPTPL